MKKYRGIVRLIFEYEFDIDAENKEIASKKLKEYYENTPTEGIFVCDANTLSKEEFKIRKKTSNDYEVHEELHIR